MELVDVEVLVPDDPLHAPVQRKLVRVMPRPGRVVEQLGDAVGGVGEVAEAEEDSQPAHVVLAHAGRKEGVSESHGRYNGTDIAANVCILSF